jgi:hypothetical protein
MSYITFIVHRLLYPDRIWGPIQWVPGALSPGLKRPGRAADHSPLTSAKVKKMWIYISTISYVFIALCLIS